MQLEIKNLKDFCDLNQFEHLILKPTFLKEKHLQLDYPITTKWYIHFWGKPKTLYYRCFKNFDQNKFNEELEKRISIDLCFEGFLEIFQSILNRFVPYKQKSTI